MLLNLLDQDVFVGLLSLTYRYSILPSCMNQESWQPWGTYCWGSLRLGQGWLLVLFQHQGEQAFGALGWREACWCKGSEKDSSPFGPLMFDGDRGFYFQVDLLSTADLEADPFMSSTFAPTSQKCTFPNLEVENMTSSARQFAFKLDCINSAT